MDKKERVTEHYQIHKQDIELCIYTSRNLNGRMKQTEKGEKSLTKVERKTQAYDNSKTWHCLHLTHFDERWTFGNLEINEYLFNQFAWNTITYIHSC